jgi:hypothetical protein
MKLSRMSKSSNTSNSNSLKKVEEKEIEILRNAVDKIESRMGKKVAQSPEVKKIIGRLEQFLRDKKLVCYGGTAINSILPEKYRFYNNDIEVPDYDFYSPSALEDAKELADIFFKMGYNEVEAKSGSHPGTFKVFVNFMPIADITQMDDSLFSVLSAKSYIKHGIRYAPTNFLRMAMYLELSRPEGDVSRWEKVLKRLTLLNKVYPMKMVNCSRISVRPSSNDDDDDDDKDKDKDKSDKNYSSRADKKVYEITRNVLLNSDVVFIGGFADVLYSRYLPKNERHKLSINQEYDVLSNNPQELATLIHMTLKSNGIQDVTVEKMPSIGEIVHDHFKVATDGAVVALIYKPTACHSYNTIKLNDQVIKIASIDTMLMFYIAFSYAKRYYYNRDRLLCLAGILFYIQNKNRLVQTGILKRFGRMCYGKQETLEMLRRDKAAKFQELKNDKHNPEYQKLFLRYVPFEHLKTRVKNIRMRKSNFQRKLKSRKNQKNVNMRTGTTSKTTNSLSSTPSSITYQVDGEALSKLKTQTIPVSKTKTKTAPKRKINTNTNTKTVKRNK